MTHINYLIIMEATTIVESPSKEFVYHPFLHGDPLKIYKTLFRVDMWKPDVTDDNLYDSAKDTIGNLCNRIWHSYNCNARVRKHLLCSLECIILIAIIKEFPEMNISSIMDAIRKPETLLGLFHFVSARRRNIAMRLLHDCQKAIYLAIQQLNVVAPTDSHMNDGHIRQFLSNERMVREHNHMYMTLQCMLLQIFNGYK